MTFPPPTPSPSNWDSPRGAPNERLRALFRPPTPSPRAAAAPAPQVISRHLHGNRVAAANSAALLLSLCSWAHNRSRLLELGVLKPAMSALKHHAAESDVCEHLFRVLRNLDRDLRVRQEIVGAGAVELLVTALETHTANAAVLLAACDELVRARAPLAQTAELPGIARCMLRCAVARDSEPAPTSRRRRLRSASTRRWQCGRCRRAPSRPSFSSSSGRTRRTLSSSRRSCNDAHPPPRVRLSAPSSPASDARARLTPQIPSPQLGCSIVSKLFKAGGADAIGRIGTADILGSATEAAAAFRDMPLVVARSPRPISLF